MKVLIGCERSQVVLSAFHSKGADVWSCDVLPSYGLFPDRHIIGDIRDVYDLVKPDLFIAHPPCTYLSKVGAPLMFPGGSLDRNRAKLGYAASDLFYWCLSRPAPFVCVENPIPMKFFIKTPYSQIVEPYYFGHPYSKATCLWLRGLPFLQSTIYVKPVASWVDVHKSSYIRSQTFSGIASAMADQWLDLSPIDSFFDL